MDSIVCRWGSGICSFNKCTAACQFLRLIWGCTDLNHLSQCKPAYGNTCSATFLKYCRKIMGWNRSRKGSRVPCECTTYRNPLPTCVIRRSSNSERPPSSIWCRPHCCSPGWGPLKVMSPWWPVLSLTSSPHPSGPEEDAQPFQERPLEWECLSPVPLV